MNRETTCIRLVFPVTRSINMSVVVVKDEVEDCHVVSEHCLWAKLSLIHYNDQHKYA